MARRRISNPNASPALPDVPRDTLTRQSLLMAASPFVLGLVAAIAAPGAAHAQAVNLGTNNIIADGTTKTHITVSGNKTSITTDTVSRGTGFNSFSNFEEAAGSQVDLYVPDGAGNLLNIVHNGPVVINGIVNGYKDGKIGGNIYFSDSHGFVVGSGGVVNVGTLTVNTPEEKYLKNVVRPDGSVDDNLAGQVMQGTLPISSDGTISIAGTINAKGDISLQGQTVDVTGGKISMTDAQNHMALFESTVNTGGVPQGRLVSEGGQIRIVAAGKARIGGKLKTSPTTSGKGGKISVKANDIVLDAEARLTADGTVAGGGGTVDVVAVDKLLVENGALISAHGAGSGTGGVVELSGHTATIGAADVDLGSDTGKAGTLLLDPYDLIIGGARTDSGAGDDYSYAQSITSNGANVLLQADNSITMESGSSINTTSATDAGNVTLEAPSITIGNGATIDASAPSYTAGDITLDAERTDNGDVLIQIGAGTGAAPVLKGNDIKLIASAMADAPSVLLSLPTAHADIMVSAGSITATGEFSAKATATANGGASYLPVGVVVTDVESKVRVDGTADIHADSAELTATSIVTSLIQTQSLVPANAKADGAVAVSTIYSTAKVEVGGSVQLHVTNDLTMSASNDITSELDATPQQAAFGASVAVSVIDAETSALIDGGASVEAGGIGLSSSTSTAVTALAAAAAGGAEQPQSGSEAESFLDDSKYSAGTETSDGGVSVVGGLAIADLTSNSTASIASTGTITSTGNVSVQSATANSADVTADGSAVDSSTGVGVAVGINLAHVKNDATVDSPISAGSLDIDANMIDPDGKNSFTTTATSGAGATNVGVAGSLATNLVDSESVATIGTSGAVTLTGTKAVNVEAADVTESSATATPSGTSTSGGKLGIGASAAVNIVANRSTAEIDGGVTGAGDVTLGAAGEFTTTTDGEAGASGGIAITPALGLSLVSNTTTAQLGTGTTFDADSLDVTAVQQATTSTTASGVAAGGKAAVGAALALAIVNDQVIATTNRAINSTGDVTFEAMGASFSTLSSTASASGGEAADDNGDSSDGTVDDKVNTQLGGAQTKESDSGIGDTDQRTKSGKDASDDKGHSASTSEGKVSVAAAVAVNVQTASVGARIPDNTVITAGGTLTLSTAANTDGKATADGTAVGGNSPPKVGIGAAVAVNKVADSNEATLGEANDQLGGLTIEATKLDIAKKLADPNSTDTRADVFLTKATSGAGGSKIGLAGSLALNLIDSESAAQVVTGAVVTITDGGAVNLRADAQNGVTATAAPTENGGASGGSVGVGVSAAINIIANRSTAEIDDGATVAAATSLGTVTLSASGNFGTDAEAEAGSSGGISVTPALGLNLVSDSTTAQLGTGTTFESDSLDVSAVQLAATTTKAKGDAAGSKAAVGLALALALVNDDVTATTNRDLDIGGAASFTAQGASTSELDAVASASGGEAADDSGDSSDGTVDDKVDNQLGGAEKKQTDSGVGDTAQKDKTTADVNDKDGRSASTSEGKVSVAAAVGVNVQTATVSATIPDTVSVTATGTLTLGTAANTDGNVTADGSAVGKEGADPSKVGIGAAVAVNKVADSNVARLGDNTHTLGGLTIEALKTNIIKPASTDPRPDVFSTTATSGAGASKVGIAGSLALNLIDSESSARIAGGADVTITGSGSVQLTSDAESGVTATAAPTENGGASGGSAGIGVSAAINIIANRSIAEFEDSAEVGGAGLVSLAASGAFETTADGTAGADSDTGIALTPALGLNLVSDTTTAQLGTGTMLSAGSLDISATQTATTTTNASASAAGGKAAVGAAIAVALVNDDVVATTNRSITTTGDVSFTAMGESEGNLATSASASGAKAADDNGDASGTSSSSQTENKDVDTKVDDQLKTGESKQNASNIGDSSQKSAASNEVDNGGDKRSAKSSEGKVSVAAAISVNVQNSSVTAVVPDGVVIDAGDKLTIASGNTTGAKTTADGSAVGEAGAKSQVGIAAAVALNVITKTTTASLGDGGSTHHANGVDIEASQYLDGAKQPVGDDYETTATSGAGGSKIGIAGSLALNLVDATMTAKTYGDVDAGGGASTISADQQITTANASALPTGNGASGGKVGIGASVALNLITETTDAELPNGITLSNGDGLTVSANSVLNTDTDAEAGAAGGVAVDAVVALAMLDQETTARIGTGTALDMPTGAIVISAESGGENTASADGEVKAGKVGIGAAAAVIIGNGSKTGALTNTSVTSATLARDITAADSLEISATAERSYDADAKATAGGGKEDTATKDASGEATSSQTLDETKDSQKGVDTSKGGSKVNVAAAVGVAVAQDVVSATLDGVSVSVTGNLKVKASNTTNMATSGDGEANDETSKVGVGIGVALGIINNTTTATIADGSNVQHAGSVTVSTATAENTDAAYADKLTALAIAGASASKVSVAGALAVGISTSSSTASIGDNVFVDSGTGAVNVSAQNESKLSAKSFAASTGTGQVGIGASVATIYADHSLVASIGANDTISGGDISVAARDKKFTTSAPSLTFDTNLKLSDVKAAAQNDALLGQDNYYAEAIGGATAGEAAISGSFAVMDFLDTTKATVGQSLSPTGPTGPTNATTLDSSGAVTINAQSDLASTALAGGVAAGNNVGVGVASAVIVSSGTVLAELEPNAEVLNATSFSDTAEASQDIKVIGVSAAAGDDAGVAGVASVISSSNSVQALLGLDSSINTSGDVTLTAGNTFTSFVLAGGAAAGGDAGIGAAASVATVNNLTEAALADGASSSDAVSLDAGGTFKIGATAEEAGITLTAAGAASGQVAAGAGAAVYVLGTTTEALVGKYAVIGHTDQPDSLTLSASDTTDLTTVAGAAAGGGTAGVGAGAAVGVVTKTVTAQIGDGANVQVGDLKVQAQGSETALTTAVGVGIGGTAGLAGAISVYSVTDHTTAEIGDATVVSQGNAAVLAGDNVAIDFISGAAGFSGTAAVGAAASVALIDNITHATIADFASVTALGKGGDVTYVTGYDPSLGSASTKYKAPTDGNYTADTTNNTDGEVLTADEAQRQGLRLLGLTRTDAAQTATGQGVIVNATGDTSVRSLAVGAGVSGTAGITISANVPVITTDTEAAIGQHARINEDNDTGADTDQSVIVAAASDTYRTGLAGSVGGGTVGIGGGIETAIVSPTTKAIIGAHASVEAKQDVIASATGHEDLIGAAAAAGVGVTVGIAGGVTVFALDSTTEATIDDGASVTAGGNVLVNADDVTRTSMVVGSLAVGATGVGVGVSIGVTDITKDTEASIAADADVTALGNGTGIDAYTGADFTTAAVANGVIVNANSNESVFTLGMTGAGGFAGLAGSVSLQLLDVTTLASVGDATINDGSGANSAQDVVVVARDSSSIAAIDGAVAIGAIGASGAVDVGILRNTTQATIADGATVDAADRVEVAGLQNTDVQSTVVGAAGGILGIAAGISVYSIGDGIDPDSKASDEVNSAGDMGSYVQGQIGGNSVTDLLASSSDSNVKTIGTNVGTSQSGVQVAGSIDSGSANPTGTLASIGDGSVTAGGAVSVAALDKLGTDTTAGSVAVGLTGLGAGVGIVLVDTTDTAQVDGTSTLSAGSLSVDATSTHNLKAKGLAGAFGVQTAEAAITVVEDNAATAARIDGATIATSGAVGVTASDHRTASAEGDGASVGLGGAVGLSGAIVNLGGSVEASLGKDGSTGTSIGDNTHRVASVTVSATSANSAEATTFAAAAGIGLALTGADSEATTATQVSALADAATIHASGAVDVSGDAAGTASASTTGYALAGIVAAGGSIAHATVNDQVNTHIFDYSLIDAGSIDLAAAIDPNTTNPVVSASADGSSGAMVGLTATEAKAANTSGANTLAEGSTLTATHLVKVEANSATSQDASADGNAGGLLAAGSNTAEANSGVTTTALLSNMVSVAGGDVTLSAIGNDTNVATSVSGSGGLVAGSAADASTTSSSVTRAAADTSASGAPYLISTIGATSPDTGTVTVWATHTDTFGGSVDSTQASLVGASGATTEHTVNATVDAHLGNYAEVSANNLALAANNYIYNYYLGETAGTASTFDPDNGGWNVDSGSGGLVNLPAGSAEVDLTQNTTATIGSNADIHLVAPTSGLSSLTMAAYNDTVSHEKVKLDSGGAIALADTSAKVNSTANATVSVGSSGTVLVDLGDISLAAWGDADLGARAAATTYGLAGAPSGRAYATYNSNNSATLGTDVRLEATDGIDPTDGSLPTGGTVSISAGTALNGAQQTDTLATTVDLYNKTAIPISTTPDAQSTVHSNDTLTIASDPDTYPGGNGFYGVNAAGDITLRASRGTVNATAVGTGKDIYREELAKAASAISNAFGGGDVTFDYHGGTVNKDGQGLVTIAGLVDTGLQRQKTITFSYAPNCDTTIAACVVIGPKDNIQYTTSGPEPVGTDILDRLDELNKLLNQYGSDPVAAGAYRNEINFLQKKLVALGLGSFDSNGVFQTNAYSGPSDRDKDLALAAQNQVDISTTGSALGSAVGSLVAGSIVTVATTMSKTYDPTNGLGKYLSTAKSVLSGLSKYGSLTASSGGDATFKSTLASLDGTLSAGKTAADLVDSLTASNATHQATIASLTSDIQTLEATLAQAQIDHNTALATATEGTIASDRTQMGSELDAISSNNSQIATQSAVAKSKAQQLQTDLDTLISAAEDTSKSGDVSAVAGLNTSTGALTRIGYAINGVDTTINSQLIHSPGLTDLNTSLQTYVTATGTSITTLTADSTTTGSIDNYLAQLGTLGTDLATNTLAAATASSSTGSPRAYTITVADTAARLGNISIVADQLTGASTGALKAPGDAAITITNNTADTLELNNLLIPTYDAGNIRLNGALVGSNTAINAINASGGGADFGIVETSADSSRPQVTITSNYNPESTLYYNPTSGDTRTEASHLPPDIILNTGKTIDDLTGAVNITSAAGNIYIHGAINAGSVNILAKNGDFVSSYVDGFDPIGGDPASFNNPTNAAEAGTGITANGAISIAARYLNINSTIQSGIADWTLNLDGTPTLTTSDETSIGLVAGTEDAALQKFKQDVAKATSAADMPSLQITLDATRGIVLDMAPEGIDATDLATKIGDYVAAYNAAVASKGPLPTPVVSVDTTGGGTTTVNIKDFLSPQVTGRIEFSKATADAYAAANKTATALYGVVSPTSNIGVSYDAQGKQYEVDGTSVHGGSIQLYGQIMNTASSGGELNVLDGFGTIDITNTSNIPVVLSTLSAGEDPGGKGRGTSGVIDITDVTGVDASVPSVPVVTVKHTVYTRDYVPGGTGQVEQQVQYGLIDPLTGQIVDEIADASKANVFHINTTTGTVTQNATFNTQNVLDITKVAAVSTGGDRTATYDTTAGQRYVWTTGDYYEVLTYFQNSGTELSGTSLEFTSVTDLTATNGPNQTAHLRLDDGTYVTMADDYTATASDQINLNGTSGVVIVAANQAATSEQNKDLEGTEFVTASQTFLTLNDLHNDGSSSSCNWWTLCIASDYTYYYHLDQKYTTVTTNSLKADHPIDINFIGSDTGAIDVNSSSNVVLTNAATASNGTVTIKATGTDASGDASSIVEGNLAGAIKAHGADLEAAGSIGDVTWSADPAAPKAAALAVNLSGGPLTATAAAGNVLVTSGSDLKVKKVTAGGTRTDGNGSVNLFTSKSITAADSSSYIEAPRVTLTALNGSVGGTRDADLLTVNTGYVPGDTTRVFGDPATTSLDTNPVLGLSVTAGGDIGISSKSWTGGNPDGTMLVDQVVSLGGNVRLVSTGQILDNNPVESVDQRTYQQLLGYWNTLGLVENTTQNDQAKQAQITAYENAKMQQYDEYWQLRGTQPYDPNFVYTPSAQQRSALTTQFAAQEQAAHPGYSVQEIADAVTADIQGFVAGKTALYQQLNTEVGSLTQSFDSAFVYQASQAEQDALTGNGSWTTRELAFSLSPGALKTVTGTNPVLKDPNVSGRTVTIDAQKGVGETVGAGTANVGVSIVADLDPSQLTVDQKVALAAAERSDIELDVLYQGSVVKIPLGTDYADLSPTQRAALDAAAANPTTHAIDDHDITIVVLSKRPLNFSATTALNVTVTDPTNGSLDIGDAYLASRGNGALANISVPGETRIKVSGNITNATGGGSISTGDLILEASQGGIGTSIKPVNLGLRSNATFIGRAQNGVYVDFTGDAAIDTVYSPQDVSLHATGALLGANKDQLINVLGTDVTLSAAAIGSLTQALNVGNNLGGGITANAGGLINLYGPANNLFVVKSATSTTGDITLDAGNEGIIDGAVTTAADINLIAGGRFVISGIGDVDSSAGSISAVVDSFKMINGATITADVGKVLIHATGGDALVTGITSGWAGTGAVVVTANDGHVLAGTDPHRPFDIKAMGSGADVTITAKLGIGDETEADNEWQDGSGEPAGTANAITDVGNPILVLSPVLSLNSTDGDIWADALAPEVTVNINAGKGNVYLQAAGKLNLGNITVSKQLTLGANDLSGTIHQSLPPSGPLQLSITGYHGAVGHSANLTVDAPDGLVMPLLKFYDSQITTTAKSVSVLSAYVPGSLLLDTPLQSIWVNDRSPGPNAGHNAQMYQPDFAFALDVDNYHTTTDAFVVWYDPTAQVTDILNGLAFDGASLVRDTDRLMYNGSALQVLLVLTKGPDGEDVLHEFYFDENGHRVVIDGVTYPVGTVGSGPAVQLSEAN